MRFAALLILTAITLVPTSVLLADPPEVQKTQKAALEKELIFSGRIVAATVEVRPRVTGSLEKILVKEGATVKKGELLAEIDARWYRLKLDQARAQLTAAMASNKAAHANLNRLNEAIKKGIVDQASVTEAEAEKEKTIALVDASKAALELAELDMLATKLIAPIDGKIGRFMVTGGNLVTADGPPIMNLVADNPLFVVFDVDEQTMLKLRRNGLDKVEKLSAAAALRDEDEFPRKVAIDFIDPQFNPQTGTVQVRGVIANPKGLISPGMHVRVRLMPPAQ